MNEKDEETRGYVYVLEVKDIDLPVCKIGMTTRNPIERCKAINNSSTGDFIWSVAHHIAVDNCKELESLVHLKLSPLRQKRREFFNINADDAYTALISIFDSQTTINRVNIEEIVAKQEEASQKKRKTQPRQNYKHIDSKYAELLQLFASTLNVKGSPFGQLNKPHFGMSDGNVGVQWNIAIYPDTGDIRLGVNLEGTAKTGGWLIAPFILSDPNIENLKTELERQQDIILRFTRDAWQGASRLSIKEEFLGGRKFALSDLDQRLWREILKEALTCLDESKNYRGRKEGQTVTLKSNGNEVVKGISPHLNVYTHLSVEGNLTDNIKDKIAELQPVYDWVVRSSQS